MEKYFALLTFFIFMISSISLMVNLYQLVMIDAKSKGIKNPKFWAFFSLAGQNGEGFLFYLWKRRKLEGQLGKEEIARSQVLKKRIDICLLGFLLGILVFVFGVIM